MIEVTVRLAEADELDSVARLYRATGYAGRVDPENDRALVALVGDVFVGVVRLCHEYRVTVLRGMRVADSYQRRGIGTALLRGLEPLLTAQDCYCLPFTHLERFYSLIGFQTMQDGEVPGFLSARTARYRSKGEAISPMVRRSGST